MDSIESYGKLESMRRWYLAALFPLVPMFAVAQDNYLPDPKTDTPMSEVEVRETFSGKTHRGTYSIMRGGQHGRNFEEWTSVTGQLLHRMENRLDRGRWTQKGPQICYDYVSEDFNAGCFSFYRRGNCIYHYQETIEGVKDNAFTAISVIKGEEPSCEPPMS